VAKLVVIEQILVTKRDPDHPLAHQRHDLVLDIHRRPPVVKARRKPSKQPDRPIGLGQQQRARIRAHRAAVERRLDATPFYRFKREEFRATLCLHRGNPWTRDKSLLHNNFLRVRAPMHLTSLRNPG